MLESTCQGEQLNIQWLDTEYRLRKKTSWNRCSISKPPDDDLVQIAAFEIVPAASHISVCGWSQVIAVDGLLVELRYAQSCWDEMGFLSNSDMHNLAEMRFLHRMGSLEDENFAVLSDFQCDIGQEYAYVPPVCCCWSFLLCWIHTPPQILAIRQ
jgi:hypothetical protein